MVVTRRPQSTLVREVDGVGEIRWGADYLVSSSLKSRSSSGLEVVYVKTMHARNECCGRNPRPWLGFPRCRFLGFPLLLPWWALCRMFLQSLGSNRVLATIQ